MGSSAAPHDGRWKARYCEIPILVDSAARLFRAESDEEAEEISKTASWCFHANSEPEAIPWLIKNILPETGTGLISGQWGTYKTTVALDIAVSVMTAEPLAGRFCVKRRGGVIYFAVEGSGGLASRHTAAARNRGIKETLPFAYRSDCPALTARGAADKLTIMVEEASKYFKDHFNVDPVLVFVDTIITAAGYAKSGDENDAALAQKVMSTLAGLSQKTETMVVGLDIFGKQAETGTRGSSAKEGHADVVLALLADRELSGAVANTRLALRKVREGAAGLELPFTPKKVELGTDPDGDPITRIVVEWGALQRDAHSKVIRDYLEWAGQGITVEETDRKKAGANAAVRLRCASGRGQGPPTSPTAAQAACEPQRR
jgi:hypothetical protein